MNIFAVSCVAFTSMAVIMACADIHIDELNVIALVKVADRFFALLGPDHVMRNNIDHRVTVTPAQGDLQKVERVASFFVVISNLPYGKRIGDEAGLKAIYAHIRKIMEDCPNWSFFLITSDKSLEKELGRKADRRRKLYNGTIETQFYQYHGTRPEKREVNHD